jgi:hypothetical protein
MSNHSNECLYLTCLCHRFRIGDVVRDLTGVHRFMAVVGVSPHGRDDLIWLAVRDLQGGPIEEHSLRGWRVVHDDSK